MGDALSLAELRGIVFALVVLSSFALLVGLMPGSFNSTIPDRREIAVSTGITGIDLLQYSDLVNFTIATGYQEYVDKTGSLDWALISAPNDDMLVFLRIRYLWVIPHFDLETFTWYNQASKAKVSSIVSYFHVSSGNLYDFEALKPAYYDLNIYWDSTRNCTAFTVRQEGSGESMDVYFTYDQNLYSSPGAAWLAGGLNIILGRTIAQDATSINGFQLILSMLFFEPVTGIPWYLADLFGFFMWSLIAVITVTMISRFIPFT